MWRLLKNGKGFGVHRALTNVCEQDRIAVVKSMEEALPTLTSYYEKNWPKWKREGKGRFDKDAEYVMYTVSSNGPSMASSRSSSKMADDGLPPVVPVPCCMLVRKQPLRRRRRRDMWPACTNATVLGFIGCSTMATPGRTSHCAGAGPATER
jgi:hypothetical protein